MITECHRRRGAVIAVVAVAPAVAVALVVVVERLAVRGVVRVGPGAGVVQGGGVRCEALQDPLPGIG